VLAAAVAPDGTLDPDAGHALVVYDARNPAFATGGEAGRQWQAAAEALRRAGQEGLLRRVSWQRLAARIDRAGGLSWLIEALGGKYGIVPEAGAR
jgi:hypothetical protein